MSMGDFAWFPFVIYFLMIVGPLCTFAVIYLRRPSVDHGPSISANILKSISSYATSCPIAIFIYHFVLSSILAAFFLGIIVRHLDIAVDLTYYTKASIKTYEAYDAIQSGQYDYSYYTFYKTYGMQRRLSSSYDDIVLIYGTGNWKNVLTSDNLVKACRAEKKMLASLSCIGESQSTMISVVFDDECNYLTSFADSLYLFGLEENSLYVEDNIDEDDPASDVLLSYMSVSCSLSLSDVNAAVADADGGIGVYYAQTDLIVDAFMASGMHDSELSVIAVVVCLFILSLSMGFNLLFGLLTIACICFSLIIAAGLLPAFGYRYFSAFNVLAIFVITGVGSDAILVFTSAWTKYLAVYEEEGGRVVSAGNCSPGACGACGVSLPPAVLSQAYGSVRRALYFTVSTTVLSFMANLVSPIVVVSQLGAFMGCAMVIYFVLLHTVMIPGWLCITILNIKFSRNKCGVCGLCRDRTPDQSFSTHHSGVSDAENRESDVSEALLQFNDDSEAVSGCGADTRGVSTSSRASSYRGSTVEASLSGCREGIMKLCGCTTVIVRTSLAVDDSIRYSNDLATRVGSDVDADVGESGTESRRQRQISASESSTTGTRTRQSRVLGCGVVLGTLCGLVLVTLATGSTISTDWGLPLLFDEENNISKLMYVAINYKSDVLSLSSDGESDIPPVVVNPPTPSPTSEFPDSGQPTHFPTLAPSMVPTLTPTPGDTALPSRAPTLMPVISLSPTYSPTASPTQFPTRYPTSAPSASTDKPTPAPVSPQSDSTDSDYTAYSVDVCYGLNVKTTSIDSVATAKYNVKSFGKYAPVGLLEDSLDFCNYLAAKRQHLELVSPNSDCLYNQLMAVSSENISIYDRVYLWMNEDKVRYKQVGVTEAAVAGNGTFGPGGLVDMSWICQPLDCRANVSSFFDDPDHALKMIDRWEKALYKKGDHVASSMNVDTLTGSDAWLFPVLSDQLVAALYVSSLLSFVGCLALLLLSTADIKLVLVVAVSMCLVISLSLLIHALMFSKVVNLIDIVVLISFIGIIIDYPTHMSFHYMHDMEKEKALTGGMISDEAHSVSISYMRKSLLGPALTTVFSAVPLLFADFTLVSKAGEYVVIMCVCTYIYVAVVLPVLLRLITENSMCPEPIGELCRRK